MDKLTSSQVSVLEVLDAQIGRIEEKLAKAQPWINELQRLKRTRQVLLSEKGTTGGGGSPRVRLTQEEVIHALREGGPMSPAELAEKMGLDGTVVRSHLNRYKDETYSKNGDGNWHLIESEED